MRHRRLSNKFLTVVFFPIIILLLMFANFLIDQPSHQAFSQQKMMQTPTGLGFDVSEHQQTINWKEIDNSTYRFVIIRTGYGDAFTGAIDQYFYENIKQVKQQGLKVGIYHYSYAMNAQEAKQEAEFVLSILDGIQLDLPVYFDFEDPCHDTLSSNEMNKIANAFLTTIKDSHYTTGIYANSDRLSFLSSQLLDQHDIWIASYGKEPIYAGEIKLWQYTNQGKIAGISTDVDINYGYYPSL